MVLKETVSQVYELLYAWLTKSRTYDGFVKRLKKEGPSQVDISYWVENDEYSTAHRTALKLQAGEIRLRMDGPYVTGKIAGLSQGLEINIRELLAPTQEEIEEQKKSLQRGFKSSCRNCRTAGKGRA